MDDNNNIPTLFVQCVSENASIPTRGSPGSAGLDLYASDDATIPGYGHGCVFTDLHIAVPEGHYGRIAPRSGLALHKSIDVGAGVIDQDYRGPINVILFNHSPVVFNIQKGHRIAQLIMERISIPRVVNVLKLPEYEANTNNVSNKGESRGSKGFGSTGI